jgi:hypothetical protein
VQTDAPVVRCSFCGKAREEVRKLIAGGSGALICDECVDLCNEIIVEEIAEGDGPNWWPWRPGPTDPQGPA